jgi:hypothetical protein
MASPYLFCRFDKFASSFSFLSQLNLVGVDISNRFRITEGHALRISIAVVTFYGHPVLDVKEGMTKGACDNASPTSDTQIFVDNHTVIIFGLPVAGLGGADLDTIGFFAVIAGHGEVDPHMLPFDDFDTGSARIACPGMMDGADQFTETASGALLLINDQYLLLHFNSPLSSSFSTHTGFPSIAASGFAP